MANKQSNQSKCFSNHTATLVLMTSASVRAADIVSASGLLWHVWWHWWSVWNYPRLLRIWKYVLPIVWLCFLYSMSCGLILSCSHTLALRSETVAVWCVYLISSEILDVYTLTRLQFRFSFFFPLLFSCFLSLTHSHTYKGCMAPDLETRRFYQVTVTAVTVIAELLCYVATFIKPYRTRSWISVWWHTALVSMVVVVHLPALMYWIKCGGSVDTWYNCFQLSFIPFHNLSHNFLLSFR